MKKWLGISILSLCLLVGFTLPATAAPVTDNLSIYGHVGLFTGWTMSDDDLAGDSRTDLRWNPWDTMYVGAKYQADNWMAEAKFDNDNNSNVRNESAYLDKAYAEIDFDAFKFGFGYNDGLVFNPTGTPPGKYGNSGIGNQIGGTNKYGARVIFPFAKGMNFAVNLGGPTTHYADQGGASDTEVTIPAVEAKLSGFTGFPWAVFGGYQGYEATYGGNDEDITSYAVGALARPSFGPAHINAVVSYATNMYITEGPPVGIFPGWAPSAPAAAGGANAQSLWNYSPDSDTEWLGVQVSAAFDITEMFGVTLGCGWQEFEADGNYEDPSLGYWVNFPIHITENFRALPYFVIDDYDTVTTESTGEIEQGTQTKFGVYWTLSF